MEILYIYIYIISKYFVSYPQLGFNIYIYYIYIFFTHTQKQGDDDVVNKDMALQKRVLAFLIASGNGVLIGTCSVC